MRRRIFSLITVLAVMAVIMPSLTAGAYDMGKAGEYRTISAGAMHTAAIKEDCSLWTCGNNEYGQLGNSTFTNRNTMAKVMDNVAAVSAGGMHTVAIKKDGSLWTWGDDEYGQLGDSKNTNKNTPVKIMDDVIAASAGGGHTAAIKTDGSLWLFGYNYGGQIGNGTTENQSIPIKIMDNVVAVSAGGQYTAAIKEDGSLWTWGRNDRGQLGDGTTENRYTPIKIMDNVVTVSAGVSYVAAIKEDGSLWTWGLNDNGQLGDSTTEERHTPAKIMDNVISVSTESWHTAAIKEDGSLWTWGYNENGQLGDGTYKSRNTPVKIIDNVIAASEGLRHTIVIKEDGSLWTWGYNHYGQLGDGTRTNRSTPKKVMDSVLLPGDNSDSVGVHKTDTQNIADNIEADLNKMLSSVTLCDTTIKGPTFDVAGYEICPLKFDAKAVLDFSGLSKNITIDEDKKKVHVILGKLNSNGQASVVQTTDTCDASWSKQYNEIKNLYKSMTGFNPSGSDSKGVNNWNKFEKMKGQLNRMNLDLFIKGSMQCVAYLDFDYQTGKLCLSEGGFVESASLGFDFKYPLIGNCLYATLGLTGSETGIIKAVVTSSGRIDPQMSIEPSITAKASITGEIPFICKAEGGIDATLAVLLQTFDPNLKVTMKGNIFLYAEAFSHKLIDWSHPYLGVELYPNFQAYSLSSARGSYRSIYNDAELTPRDYLYSISLMSLGTDDAIYEQNGVYPNNNAQLLKLPNDNMMLVWVGDNGTKSSTNRTSLMYSIFDGGQWSEAKTVNEDGTAIGEFKAVSNGSKAYIVYQKLSREFEDSAEIEDILADSDLYVIEYENGGFGEPVRINNYENTNYEYISDIAISGDKLNVAWIENSQNDVFLSSGTTKVKMRGIQNDTPGNISEIVSCDSANNEYPGDVHIMGEKAVYAEYAVDGEDAASTLYEYADGVSKKLIDSGKIYNIKNINDDIYYIKDSNVYRLVDNAGEELVAGNVSSFETVTNGIDYAMLMSVSDGARNEIYISNLESGEWSAMEHFTDLGQYIRSYSPFMHSDGNINLAVSTATVNDDIEDSESVYGNTSILVLKQCDYFDISTSYVYYDEDEIIPDSDMNIYFDVINNSADKLTNVKVKLTDEQGAVSDEQNVSCNIEPHSSESLNIKYHLPHTIEKTLLNLEVSADKEEKRYDDNKVSLEFGYADLSVSPINCTVNSNNTADIKSSVTNTGFTKAEGVTIKVYNGSTSGDVLAEFEAGTMEPGDVYDVNYTFPSDKMVSLDEDVMNAVYIQVSSSTREAKYSDNEEKVAFDSYSGSASATFEPTVSPTATPTITPTTTPTATPNGTPSVNPTAEPQLETPVNINDIQIAGRTVNIDITKLVDCNAKLIVTSYTHDGRLIGVALADIDQSGTFNLILNVNGADYVSAFAWNSISHMIPISNKVNKDL